MLNLFKLPFRFGSSDEKTTPTTDIAIGIYQNYRRRNFGNSSDGFGHDDDFLSNNCGSLDSLSGTKSEDFYEIMTQSLRHIDDDIDRLR